MENLSLSLLSALESFDQQTAPQGLYAAEEHGVTQPAQRWLHEWNGCLADSLNAHGCHAPKVFRLKGLYDFTDSHQRLLLSFLLPDHMPCHLGLLRVSKIKVRKYGNAYRIDPSRDFAERWQQLRLKAHFKHLDRVPMPQMLLLVAFDRKIDPVGAELRTLKESSNWERHGWHYRTRSWLDPHGRGFYTRAVIWFNTASIPAEEADLASNL